MADANMVVVEKEAYDDSIDEKPIEVLKYEIENLKVALMSANDALTVERRQKLADRKTYEAKVAEVKTKYKQIYVDEIEKYCNEKFKALNDEHEAKVKSMEDDHEKSLKMLRQPPSPTLCDQSLQTLPVQLTNRSQQTAPENFSDDSMIRVDIRVIV